jgi:putative membrane protein
MDNLKVSMLAFLLCGGLVLASCSNKSTDSEEIAEEQNDAKFDDRDQKQDAEFAVSAADGGMLEVQLGKLAQSNGASEEVKRLGEMMVTDHSKANDELAALAAQKNITLPTALSESSQKKYNDLAEKTGKDFDEAYADFMVKDHKDDIDEFKKQAENGNDAELKAWAAGKVPTLEHHLQFAERTKAAVDSLKKL